MPKPILILLLLLATIAAQAQTTDTSYFKDQSLRKQVPERRAKLYQTTWRDKDSNVTITVRWINTGDTLACYRNDEPVGVWTVKKDGNWVKLHYDFELRYLPVAKDKDTSTNNKDTALNGTWPKLDNGQKLTMFLMANGSYPQLAIQRGISGRVVMRYNVTETGEVEDVKVKQGCNVMLDKEAMRMIRMLRYTTPGMKDGKPAKVYITQPLTFKLPE